MRRWLPLVCALAACSVDPAPVVVLVTLDTTRADALGSYADVSHWGLDLVPALRPTPSTPVLDGLAAAGVRHRWALSHAPTTLASHASLMSGRDTRGAHVPRNGFPVETTVPLLAARFRAEGWDTRAVVGASVLSADQGLSRGFALYDDAVTEKVRRRYEHRAEQVVDRALAAVDARSRWDATHDKPLFLWVHFFDPHSPWDSAPPEIQAPFLAQDPDYKGIVDGKSPSVDQLVRATKAERAGTADRRRARALYLAEVAAVDAALGRLLDGLEARFAWSDSLVVVAGDHGEALDQPAERPYGHGGDVDLVATHVPLLFTGSQVPHGTVVDTPVGLMDVAPTIAHLAGLPPDPTAQGVDLSTLWAGATPDRVLLAEATKPADVEAAPHWNNVRKERLAVGGGLVLTHTPWADAPGPHVFRLAPGQPALPDAPAAAVSRLVSALRTWDDSAPSYRDPDMSAETVEALRALGYLDN